MFILYFALWVVLNGRWTTEIALLGLVFAAAAYAFTWKYMGFGPKLDAALFRRLPSALRYGVTLVGEILKANLAVCRIILDSKKEVRPQLVRFDVDLKKNRHLVALANSITLTPGTITVDLEDHFFTVHALDAAMVEGLDDGVFVQALMDMEVRHGLRGGEMTEQKPEESVPAEEDIQAEETVQPGDAEEKQEVDGE